MRVSFNGSGAALSKAAAFHKFMKLELLSERASEGRTKALHIPVNRPLGVFEHPLKRQTGYSFRQHCARCIPRQALRADTSQRALLP